MTSSSFVRPQYRRLAKLAIIPALATALLLAGDTKKADAGGFGFGIGAPGLYGVGVPVSPLNRYGVGYRGVRVGGGFGYGFGYSAGFRGVSPYRSYFPRVGVPVQRGVPFRSYYPPVPRRSFYGGGICVGF